MKVTTDNPRGEPDRVQERARKMKIMTKRIANQGREIRKRARHFVDSFEKIHDRAFKGVRAKILWTLKRQDLRELMLALICSKVDIFICLVCHSLWDAEDQGVKNRAEM